MLIWVSISATFNRGRPLSEVRCLEEELRNCYKNQNLKIHNQINSSSLNVSCVELSPKKILQDKLLLKNFQNPIIFLSNWDFPVIMLSKVFSSRVLSSINKWKNLKVQNCIYKSSYTSATSVYWYVSIKIDFQKGSSNKVTAATKWTNISVQ